MLMGGGNYKYRNILYSHKLFKKKKLVCVKVLFLDTLNVICAKLSKKRLKRAFRLNTNAMESTTNDLWNMRKRKILI